MKNTILKIAAVVLALFSLLTVFVSSSVIFDLFGIRAKEGNYVLFVVVANFICGFLYLPAVYGLCSQKKWTTKLLILCIIILVATFIGLLLHINAGGIYETKTVKAMIFRITLTSVFTGLSWFYISKQSKN